MPSPFPGMDPYLEGHLWSHVHSHLIVASSKQLQPLLRPKYVAFTQKYFLFDSGDDVEVGSLTRYPDLGIAQKHGNDASPHATAIMDAPLTLETFIPHKVPQTRIEIRQVGSLRLVGVIEFLSPVNKRGRGRRKCLVKRNEILASSAHLMEVDLLRRGYRVPMVQSLPQAPYFVILSRARQRPKVEVWPIQMDEACPTVPVPLADGDADIPLNIQAALEEAYESGGCDIAINYEDEPEPRWSDAERAWAEQRLAQLGFRKRT